ncbi:DUF2637 domain-containing protein [Melissospora conviva]|uniref:DUF2637 domain-containing protein n=1 Tax=Melissospora conviva TaxID=3388432 RepID=UPI003C1D999A
MTIKPRTHKVEGVALVLILLTVAGFAGAASFTHVKDWTLANSPTGTGEWFGWANAVISELVPVAALLTIRQRRRAGLPVGYPVFLLMAAAGLSLAAQVAVAKPSPSGWLLSAVPALAFMALVKLVLATEPAPAPQPAPSVAPVSAETTPAPAPRVEQPAPAPTPEPAPAPALASVPAPAPAPAPAPVEPARPAAVPSVPLAPVAPTAFSRRNGTPLTGEVTR